MDTVVCKRAESKPPAVQDQHGVENKTEMQFRQQTERLTQSHLNNESLIRRLRQSDLRHGDTVPVYINLGDVHHEEVVAYINRSITKNFISLALANELQLNMREGKSGILIQKHNTTSTSSWVVLNLGCREIVCHVVDEQEHPLVLGRDLFAEVREM